MPETSPAGLPSWASEWMKLWSPGPQALSQPILPGWSFGNVTVNAQNSSAPATEQAIVSAESYGRQIGKLLDAVCALVEAQGDAKTVPAYAEVVKLHNRVKAIKTEAAARRIDQLRQDLALLKSTDKKAYEQQLAALRDLLAKD